MSWFLEQFMLTAEQCARGCGVGPEGMACLARGGVTVEGCEAAILVSIGDLKRNPQAASDLLGYELRATLDLGLTGRALGILGALRLFLHDHPDIESRLARAAPIQRPDP